MIETINGKAYLKVGDKVYEVGGGSNIITADTVEQLPDPASVPEGTIALVKSEGESGGSGLPTVELETVLSPADGVTSLSDADNAKMDAAVATGKPFGLVFTMITADGTGRFVTCPTVLDVGAMQMLSVGDFALMNAGEGWSLMA